LKNKISKHVLSFNLQMKPILLTLNSLIMTKFKLVIYVCWIALLPIALLGQKKQTFTKAPVLEQATQQLDPSEVNLYMQKMNFDAILGFEATGNLDVDKRNYSRLKAYDKINNPKIAPVGNYKPSGTLQGRSSGNDLCSDAEVITCGQTVTGSTSTATFDDVGTCGTSNTTAGVWYSLTPAISGTITLSTCNQAAYDTKISVFTGTCGSLTCVTGVDDAAGCGGFTTELALCVVSGETYLILVHGFGNATGVFDLTVSCSEISSINDDVCNATPVTVGGSALINNFCASVQPGEPSPGAGTGSSSCNSQDGWCSFETDLDNSVWYSFTAPASGCVSITADGPGFDSQLALWEADGCTDFSTFSEIAANDDSAGDILPGAFVFAAGIIESACLNPGQTYYIQVDGFNGDAVTNGTLEITDCGNPPLAVDAGDCQSRFLGYAPAEADFNILCASGSGGFPPYTYSWSPTGIQSNGECISTQPNVTTTYTVVVTDAKGCTAEDMVTVNVIDLAEPCNGKKNLQVCHVPPGNSGNSHEICINSNAVASHLAHGDRLGPCDNTCLATNPNPFLLAPLGVGNSETISKGQGITAKVFPNPFEGMTTIQFSLEEDGYTSLSIYSMTGAKVATPFEGNVSAETPQRIEFRANDLTPGVYFYMLTSGNDQMTQGKLILLK
jgi:hypothetical protein